MSINYKKNVSDVSTLTEEEIMAIPYLEDSEFDSDEELYHEIISTAPVKLTREQIDFLDLAVKKRKNLLLMASAGNGKTVTIGTAVDLFQSLTKPYDKSWFEKQYGVFCNVESLQTLPTIGLCASTGRAASLIKGRTLHSYLGIGLAKGSVEDLVKRVSTVKYMRNTLNHLRSVQVMIIDEVSMISSQLIDKISLYLQKIRRNNKPFGNIQMIFVGDFAQLAPVEGNFMFNSTEFKRAKVITYRLTKCFRQSDPAFLNILNETRYGHCSDESFNILKDQISIDEEYSRGLKPLRILSTNAEVDRINEQELQAVVSESVYRIATFPIRVIRGGEKKAEVFRKIDGIPEEVRLVVGAQIIITHNLTKSIVNGSQGRVFSVGSREITVMLLDGEIVDIPYIEYKDPEHPCIFTAPPIFSYLPVRLGYAMTIHKCQGATIRLLEVDLSRVFCHGQGYVALSRCESFRGLIVKGLSKKAFICDPEVKRFYGVE